MLLGKRVYFVIFTISLSRKPNTMKRILCLLILCCCFAVANAQAPRMMYGDADRTGRPFSKDPYVINYGGRYLMYYTIPSKKGDPTIGTSVGIAESRDLTHWQKVGEITAASMHDSENKGLAAPGFLVRDGVIHMFYQNYPKDGSLCAICHATSTDGINFECDTSNPIFRPTGEWNNGRAIDAEVIFFKGRYFLYYATRDPKGKVQMQGVATADADTDFSRGEWSMASDAPILKPELPWEKLCIEAASIIRRGNRLVMFYAGAYNNSPQQIGVAISRDGMHWKRMFDEPFLANGKKGEWNERESGHPHIFEDTDGRTYLFFQGNKEKGHWYLSNIEIGWRGKRPYIKQ